MLKIQDKTQVKPHHLRFVFSVKIFYLKMHLKKIQISLYVKISSYKKKVLSHPFQFFFFFFTGLNQVNSIFLDFLTHLFTDTGLLPILSIKKQNKTKKHY